jgi:hypothetical protein
MDPRDARSSGTHRLCVRRRRVTSCYGTGGEEWMRFWPDPFVKLLQQTRHVSAEVWTSIEDLGTT